MWLIFQSFPLIVLLPCLNSSLADCDLCLSYRATYKIFKFKFLFGRLWHTTIFFHQKQFYCLNSSLADCDAFANPIAVGARASLNSSLADCDAEKGLEDTFTSEFKFLFGRLWLGIPKEKYPWIFCLNSSLADCDKLLIYGHSQQKVCLNSSLADCDLINSKTTGIDWGMFKFLFGRLWRPTFPLYTSHLRQFKFLFGRLWPGSQKRVAWWRLWV